MHLTFHTLHPRLTRYDSSQPGRDSCAPGRDSSGPRKDFSQPGGNFGQPARSASQPGRTPASQENLQQTSASQEETQPAMNRKIKQSSTTIQCQDQISFDGSYCVSAQQDTWNIFIRATRRYAGQNKKFPRHLLSDAMCV